jgi:hypothetical protein
MFRHFAVMKTFFQQLRLKTSIQGFSLAVFFALLLGISSLRLSSEVLVQPAVVVIDTSNNWRHAIGSPLITNQKTVVDTFIGNCELTPPPGALPIVDVPENHSANYAGYPAYVANFASSGRSYFVCDGFLNSTSWCSFNAHREALKLLRVVASRGWEPKATSLVPQDSAFSSGSLNHSVHQSVQDESTLPSTQNSQPKILNWKRANTEVVDLPEDYRINSTETFGGEVLESDLPPRITTTQDKKRVIHLDHSVEASK